MADDRRWVRECRCWRRFWRWQAVAPGHGCQVRAAHEATVADLVPDRSTAGLQMRLPLTEPGRFALRLRTVGPDGVAGSFGAVHP